MTLIANESCESPADVRGDERAGDDSRPNGVVCRCGAERSTNNPRRCARGHTWKGESSDRLVTDGREAVAFWTRVDVMRNDLVTAVLRDKGFTTREEAPVTVVFMADVLAQSVLLQQNAWHRIVAAHGPLSSSDRERRVFATWCKASERGERACKLLGLSRTPRAVSADGWDDDD